MHIPHIICANTYSLSQTTEALLLVTTQTKTPSKLPETALLIFMVHTENRERGKYLNIIVGNTVIQIGNVELGPSFYGRSTTTLSWVRRHSHVLICIHIVLPRRLRRLKPTMDQIQRKYTHTHGLKLKTESPRIFFCLKKKKKLTDIDVSKVPEGRHRVRRGWRLGWGSGEWVRVRVGRGPWGFRIQAFCCS